jgi:hypothetical protein
VEGTKTPAGGRGRGDPAGAQRRGGSPDRTARGKRSAWSGNQLATLTEPILKIKLKNRPFCPLGTDEMADLFFCGA